MDLREFALLAPPDALASREAGIVTRFVVGALLVSHGARRDAKVSVYFGGAGAVSFEGASMRNVRPDEQSLSGILRAGLRKVRDTGGGRVMQGIYASDARLEDSIARAKGTRVYYRGQGGRAVSLRGDFCAVFEHPALAAGTEGALTRAGFVAVNLGAVPMPVDQAAVVANIRADRDDCRQG